MQALGIAKLGLVAWCATLPLIAQDIPADVGETRTTESGLSYCVLRKGDGTRHPTATEKVKVHYTGWLTDGTKFDSSRGGDPAVFGLNQVIKGWGEGVALMRVGDRFKFTIPPELGYGSRGAGGSIPPDSTLVFDVELVSVQPSLPPIKEDKVETTESGIRYLVINEGEGEVRSGEQIYDMGYEIFTPEGVYQAGSWQRGAVLPPQVFEQFEFLKELAPKMKPGAQWRVDVPPGKGSGPQAQVWLLDLRGFKEPLKVPAFSMPDDSELTKTESGLRYKILEAGDAEAASPSMGQQVTVHYAGWLSDGSLFDSSFGRGEPSSFELGRVVQGWNEGLQLMKPGGKALFVIPPELGYGAGGAGERIPPNSTLVFHVELIGVDGR